MAATRKTVTSFRLASLLRLEKNPYAALKLFRNPNPKHVISQKPFRYSLLCYDIIITKLGRAKMFDELESVLNQLKYDTRIIPQEIIFCNVINFFCRGRLPGRALKMFDEMPSFRCRRTVKSVNTLLNVLLKFGKFEEMKEMLANMEKFGSPDACSYNILIHGCLKGQYFDDAWDLFEEMVEKGIKPTAVTFGTLINGLCLNMKVKEALKLKSEMFKLYGVMPTSHIYASLVDALCRMGELDAAFRLKDEMIELQIKLDSAIYSTLIKWLLDCERKEKVSILLEEMRGNGCKPDTVTYNVIINAHCREHDFDSAFKVLNEMAGNGCAPDVISYNVILSGMFKGGKRNEGTALFEDMPRRGCVPDVVSYRILFDGLCSAGQFKQAGLILDEMVFKGFKPRSGSLDSYLQGLSENEKFDCLGRVFNRLESRRALDADLWWVAVSVVCKDRISDILKIVDNVITQ